MVMPGETYTYQWEVPARSGPGSEDPSSLVWLYHSHVDGGIADEYSGLVGAIVMSDAKYGTASGIPSDVGREMSALFMVEDENTSHYIDDNIQTYAPLADPNDEAFHESNLTHSING